MRLQSLIYNEHCEIDNEYPLTSQKRQRVFTVISKRINTTVLVKRDIKPTISNALRRYEFKLVYGEFDFQI